MPRLAPDSLRSALRAILLPLLAVVAGAAPAAAASFGVPITGTSADGWFILVGKDALGEDQSNYFGDITRELSLNIEVTGTALRVCVYDPGLYDSSLPPGQAQLDFRFQARAPGCAPVQMSYELYAPGNPVAIKKDDTTYGGDTGGGTGSNRALWCFYDSARDGAVTPGVYTFVARMLDGPCVDEDVNVFGVSIVPDEYDAYAWYATVGHSAFSSALLANRYIRLYPWAVAASAGQDSTGGQVCGLDLSTFDLDGPTSGMAPPSAVITTTQGFADPPYGASIDGGFHSDSWPDMAPYNAGDDHGIYTVELSGLGDPVRELNRLPAPCVPSACPAAGIDFNAFSFQLYQYGAAPPFQFSDYPVSPGHPRMASHVPRRIYLPHQNGQAPVKEYLGHRILNPPAGGFPVGFQTPVNLEIRIENPTAYPLTNLTGRSRINQASQVSAPRTPVASAGGTATVTGRRIDFAFPSVPARSTATVTYTLDFQPTATGPFFLTGDGSDFTGGTRPTTATWDTPFVTAEAGAPCMIQVNVITPACSVNAAGTAPASVCSGAPIPLDGGGSAAVACPGTQLEYRWTGPGLPASPPFGTNPVTMVSAAAAGTHTYTLEARCQGDPTCVDTATVDVTVSAAEQPTADAGPDRSVATCDVPFVVGTPGDPAKFTYTWSPAGLLSSNTVPQPSFTQAAPGTYNLTLDVVAIADRSCVAQDTLQVEIVSGAPTGSLGNRLRAVRAGGNIALSWTLGVVTPDRYNVHRTATKAELDRGNYRAPVVNPSSPIFTGGYSELLTPSPTLYHYQVYGRDCGGNSVIN